MSHSPQALKNVVEREINSGKFNTAERGTINVSELTAHVSLLFPRRAVERVVNERCGTFQQRF